MKHPVLSYDSTSKYTTRNLPMSNLLEAVQINNYITDKITIRESADYSKNLFRFHTGIFNFLFKQKQIFD